MNSRLRRNMIFRAFLLLALTTLLGTLTLSQVAAAPVQKVLRYNFPIDYGGARLDIARTFTIFAPNIFLGLTRLNPKNEVIPGAAESWKVSPDGKTYTFSLRRGLTWSDGVPLTAHDFEFGWKRALDPATKSVRAWQLYLIEGAEAYNQGKGTRDKVGVEALDDYTLEVRLASPAPFFPAYAAGNNVYYSSPKHVIEKVGDEWIDLKNLVFSGPFKITRMVTGSSVILERNPAWRGEPPKIDRVEYYVIPDPSVVLARYEAGGLDFAQNLPLGEVNRIRNDPRLKGEFVSLPDFRVLMLQFNVKKRPYDSVKVRQAILHSIDQRVLSAGPFRGVLPPAYSLRPPEMVGGDLNYMRDAYNPDLARKLLAEAGYPGGKGFPKIIIQTRNEEDIKLASEFIRHQLTTILNIPVEIQLMDTRALLDMVTQGRGEMWQSATFALSNDLYDLYNVIQGLFRQQGWQSRYFDDLLARAAREQNATRRMNLYNQAERFAVETHAIAVPLWATSQLSMIKPYVRGLREDKRSIWLHTWEYIDVVR